MAIAVGRTTYDNGLRTSAAQTTAGHWTRGTLLENAPNATTSTPDSPTLLTSLAKAKWQQPDGTWREGKVPTRAGTPQGAQVRVWVDSSGKAAKPPLSESQVSDKAVATGLTTWMAVELGIAITYILLRWLVERRRLSSWDAEWARVAPRWTRKLR